MNKSTNLAGKVFNHLTVEHRTRLEDGRVAWKCKCTCGNKKTVTSQCLTTGDVKSCGCIRLTVKHGMYGTKVYRAWLSMKDRCTRKKHRYYHRYGGRGITFCEAWQNFDAFFSDMGEPLSDDLTLDRINNNGNYCKENCRWATQNQQMNNTSQNIDLKIGGKRTTINELSLSTGICASTLYKRVANGYSEDEVINGKLKKGGGRWQSSHVKM